MSSKYMPSQIEPTMAKDLEQDLYATVEDHKPPQVVRTHHACPTHPATCTPVTGTP